MVSDPRGDARDKPATGLTTLERFKVRLLHVYFRCVRGLTLGVRVAVLNDRGEVFLVRHTYTPGWHLPGGGVEVGETLEEAVAKELREEARISLTGPAQFQGIFFNRGVSRRDHIVLYIVRDFAIDAVKQPDREIAEAGFFPLAALPEGLTPATRRRLDEIIRGTPPSSDW